MSCRNWQVEEGSGKNGQGRIQIRSKTINGFHLKNLSPHGGDNLPPTYGCTTGHRSGTGQFNPGRYIHGGNIAS